MCEEGYIIKKDKICVLLVVLASEFLVQTWPEISATPDGFLGTININSVSPNLKLITMNVPSISINDSKPNQNLKTVFLPGPVSLNETHLVTSSTGDHAETILRVSNATNISYSWNESQQQSQNASADLWLEVQHADHIFVSAQSDANSGWLRNNVTTVIDNGSLEDYHNYATAGNGEENTSAYQSAKKTTGGSVYVETYAQNNESQQKKWFSEPVTNYNITCSSCAKCTNSCILATK
jgi:hypothetical protein